MEQERDGKKQEQERREKSESVMVGLVGRDKGLGLLLERDKVRGLGLGPLLSLALVHLPLLLEGRDLDLEEGEHNECDPERQVDTSRDSSLDLGGAEAGEEVDGVLGERSLEALAEEERDEGILAKDSRRRSWSS